MNKNGQRLLELCCYHQLCISNTYFQTKLLHRVSWRHPRSKRWHQHDFFITRREALDSAHFFSTFHNADCDTQHSLVHGKVNLQPIGRSQAEGTAPHQRHFLVKSSSSSHHLIKHSPPPISKVLQTSGTACVTLFTTKQQVRKNADWFEANAAIVLYCNKVRKSRRPQAQRESINEEA